VKFASPAGAERGRFTAGDDGRWTYRVRANVRGLGALSVSVGPRGDPECTLVNELIGAEAQARTKYFRRSHARVIPINRSKGVQSLENGKDGSVAHATTWSRGRQFEFSLEGSGDPLSHPVWKRLMESFRSDEPPLK
jgi:hypothetical protein